jgi:hypothetical protein
MAQSCRLGCCGHTYRTLYGGWRSCQLAWAFLWPFPISIIFDLWFSWRGRSNNAIFAFGMRPLHSWGILWMVSCTQCILAQEKIYKINIYMNIVSIVVAATAGFIIAFLWNGPVFGKLALRLSNMQNPPVPKLSQILLNYLVFLVTATIMSLVFWIAFKSPIMGNASWFRGTVLAIWLWLGFNVMATSIDVIWHGKSWKLWLFECAASFVVFSTMGAILGSF